MRFNDEYKFLKESCMFDIVLEDYISKLEVREDLLNFDVNMDAFSPRLFLDDRNDIIIRETFNDEISMRNIIVFDIGLSLKDRVQIEDDFFIEIFEHNISILKINVNKKESV